MKLSHRIKSSDVVYISGPMTGLPEFNKPAFNAMESRLAAAGCRVLNPARQPDGLEYAEYMRRAVHDLLAATRVVFLTDHHKSRGAMLEWSVAYNLGLPMHYEERNDERKGDSAGDIQGAGQPV